MFIAVNEIVTDEKIKKNFAGLPWHVFIFVVNGFNFTYCKNIIVSNLWKPDLRTLPSQ